MSNPRKLKIKTGKFKEQEIEYRVGYLIVQLKHPGKGWKKVLHKVLGEVKFKIINHNEHRWVYLRVEDEAEILPLAKTLSEHPDINWAEPDIMLRGATIPNDPMVVAEQWGIECIHMFEAWDIQTGDDSVVIGLLDTGIPLNSPPSAGPTLYQNLDGYVDHYDLEGKRFIAGSDYVDGTDWPQDSDGHGTNMVGIIAAREKNMIGLAGINWGCLVYVTRVLDMGKITSVGYMLQGVQETIEYANTNDKKVVFNFCATFNVSHLLDLATFCQSIFPLFESVVDNGAIICMAAGNGYTEGDPLPFIEFPARLGIDFSSFAEHVVVVGAVSKDLTIWEGSGRGEEDMVFAPGDLVGTTDLTREYDPEIGTSVATSHVSGLAALMWSEAPDKTAEEIVECLKWSAQEPFPRAGYHIVNAYAALRTLQDFAELMPINFDFVNVAPGFHHSGKIEIEVYSSQSATLEVSVADHSFGVVAGNYHHNPCHNPLFSLGVIYDLGDSDVVSGTVTIKWVENPSFTWVIEINASR